MKIYSKFSDYYDIGLAHGIDENLHYMRARAEFEFPDQYQTKLSKFFSKYELYATFARNTLITSDYLHRARTFLIGACGKYYPVVAFNTPLYDYGTTVYFTDSDQIKEYLIKKDKNFKPENWGKPRKKYGKWDRKPKSDKHKLDNIFNNMGNGFYELTQNLMGEDLFIKYGCPLLMINRVHEDRGYAYRLVANPTLKQFGFYRAFDAYTMFQNISMYLGGVLCNKEDPDPSNVGDKYLLTQKGFDKMSFKKEATKRK